MAVLIDMIAAAPAAHEETEGGGGGSEPFLSAQKLPLSLPLFLWRGREIPTGIQFSVSGRI